MLSFLALVDLLISVFILFFWHLVCLFVFGIFMHDIIIKSKILQPPLLLLHHHYTTSTAISTSTSTTTMITITAASTSTTTITTTTATFLFGGIRLSLGVFSDCPLKGFCYSEIYICSNSVFSFSLVRLFPHFQRKKNIIQGYYYNP